MAAEHFQQNDRALCIQDRSAGKHLSKGQLYCVHGTTLCMDGNQVLWLSSDAKARGEGWDSKRFLRVRPTSTLSCNHDI